MGLKMNEKNTYYHYTAADLRRYLNGEMTSTEMYALEKQALEDPFLADAIEGYAGITADAAQTDLVGIKEKLNISDAAPAKVVVMHPPARRFQWWKLSVAAAITGLLLFAGARLFNKKSEKIQVADNSITKKETAVQTPATPAAGTLTKPPPAVQDSIAATNKNFNDYAAVTTDPAKPPVFVKPDSILYYYKGKMQAAVTKGDIAQKDTLKNKLTGSDIGGPDFLTTVEGRKIKAAPDTGALSNFGTEVALEKKSNREFISPTTPVSRNADDREKAKALVFNNNTAPAAKENDIALNNNTRFKKMSTPAVEQNAAAAGMVPNNTRSYNFNYRITDPQGNTIPFTNIIVPADNFTTYSRADGSFGLFSTDSVLQVNVRAAGFAQQSLNLRSNAANNGYSNSNLGNIVLAEDKSANKDMVIVGDQKNYALKKKSGVLKGTVEETEPSDGWESYDAYLANNININNQPKGEVELSFSVNKKGDPVDVKVDKSLGAAADQEAIRLLTQGPKWKGLKRKKAKGKVVVTF
jgi:hypothetical protein